MVGLESAAHAAGMFRPGTGVGCQYSQKAGSYVRAGDRPRAEGGR